MSYELVESKDGQYAIDWEVVRRIVRSNWHAIKQAEHSKEVTVSERTWNPFSWMLPEVTNVEVDWGKVRRETDSCATADVMALQWNAKRSVRELVRNLQERIRHTRELKRRFRDRMSRLQTQNAKNIENSVANYETATGATRLVRDTSFETVMIMAGTMSGGAAYAALGAGSILKGTAKWQDTGNVGAAVIETTGSFMLSAIPVARKASGEAASITEKLVLVTMEAKFETLGAMVEGDTIGEAFAKGSVKLLAPGIGGLVKSGAVQDMLSRAVVPAKTKIVSEYLEGYAKFAFGKGAGVGIDKMFEKPAPSRNPNNSGAVARATCDSDLALLRLAIVDMKKGIALADVACAAQGH